MASTCSTCQEPLPQCDCFWHRRPVAETSLSSYKSVKDYLERAKEQELAKMLFSAWHHFQQEVLEASLSSTTDESSPSKQAHMLKASFGDEIRRCKLTWPSHASEDDIYQVIHEAIEKVFPRQAGTSTQSFKFKYADDEGDFCTLGPTAICDFLEMARGKMLRLHVFWHDPHCNNGSRDTEIAGLRAEIERLRATVRMDDEFELIPDEDIVCSEHPRCRHPRPAWLKVKEGWDWCSLCKKYAIPQHLNSKKHKKRLRWREWWEAWEKHGECNGCHSLEPCENRSEVTQESVTQPGTVSAEMAGAPSEPLGSSADAPDIAFPEAACTPTSLSDSTAHAPRASQDQRSESVLDPDPWAGAHPNLRAQVPPLEGQTHMQMLAEPEGDDSWSNYVGLDIDGWDNNTWWNNTWWNNMWSKNDGDDTWGNYDGWGCTNHRWCNRKWRNNNGYTDHGWGDNQRRGGAHNY